MKNILLTLSLIFGSSIFAVNAMPSQDLDIQVMPRTQGAWVTVTQNGQPVSGATVNDKYMTSVGGRVFVFVNGESPRSAEFIAVTPEGETISTRAFIPRR